MTKFNFQKLLNNSYMLIWGSKKFIIINLGNNCVALQFSEKYSSFFQGYFMYRFFKRITVCI